MNPLLQETFGSVVRWALAIGAGVLVQRGIWTQNQATDFVGAAALALVALGWSLYQKYQSRQLLVTALAVPAAVSENEVQQHIDAGNAADVTTPKDVVPV